MAECEYLHCLKDADHIRTVSAPHGHAWTVSVCEAHAKSLDAGLPMGVYVYVLKTGVPA